VVGGSSGTQRARAAELEVEIELEVAVVVRDDAANTRSDADAATRAAQRPTPVRALTLQAHQHTQRAPSKEAEWRAEAVAEVVAALCDAGAREEALRDWLVGWQGEAHCHLGPPAH
jgi:hypothetical protein